MINQKYITYNKTTSKEFEFLHLSYATAVAMATIGNFRFARLRNLVRLRVFSVKYLLLQTFYHPFFCIPHLYSNTANSCAKPRTIISF